MSALLLIAVVVAKSVTGPIVAKSALFPEPGVLALLGGGLVGLATLLRRHFGD